MTIVEHLVEFRRRFIAVVLCFFLVFCITLLFAGEIYAYLTRGFEKPLLVLGPNDILWIYINLASLMAFTVTLPFTTYQIWQFVKPGLRDNEARAIFAYIPATFVNETLSPYKTLHRLMNQFSSFGPLAMFSLCTCSGSPLYMALSVLFWVWPLAIIL